jgi:hypothetical protein
MTRQFQDPCLEAEAKATPNLSLQTAADQDRLPASSIPMRCSEKGCVFPAARATKGKCLDHDRRYCVPELFHSFQPTMLLMDQAKYILPDSEFEDSRHLDRRRLADDRLAAFEEAT